ncbi:MAG: preprotein translocase subunit YajC [Planctomycetota bacterium]
MLSNIHELMATPMLLLAQKTGEVTGETQPTGAPDQSLITQILGNPLNLILISGILFVLLVLRPQQWMMKELQNSLASLKKNDRVVTSSGIHGTITQANAGESTVVLRIDDNSGAKITMNRDAIAKVLTDETEAEEKNK